MVLSKEAKDRINSDVIKKYAELAYRNITFAYKDISLDEFKKKDLTKQEDVDFLETNLIFYCLCGIQDPLRPEII
jgi:magnesium-transporting ATPase (P-type)